jgi:hypothetical protein
MKPQLASLFRNLIALALCFSLTLQLLSTTVNAGTSGGPPIGLPVMQLSGQGFGEGLQAGSRAQARLFIWSLEGADQSILGPDVPLFEPGCVAKFGEGVQCAYFPVLANAVFGEYFNTAAPDEPGDTAIRFAAGETWRVFFDPNPDGSRTYENLASFEKGNPIANYSAREWITADVQSNFVMPRNILRLVSSTPVTLNGVTIDFAKIAPRVMGLGHAHSLTPLAPPQPIPTNEPPFGSKPGFFTLHEALSGTFQAIQ